MRARQWVVGLSAAGAVLGLAISGCGSNSSTSEKDASAEAGDDGNTTPCTPMAVNPSDSGACTICTATMCGKQVAACNADCTCGSTINQVNTCIAGLPPMSADAAAGLGGLTALLPGAMCLAPLVGGIGGGGGGPSMATTGLFQCLLTSCMAQCLGGGMPVGGADAAPRSEGGADTSTPDASTGDAPGDVATVDATPDAAGSDASSDASPPDGGSSDTGPADADEGGQ